MKVTLVTQLTKPHAYRQMMVEHGAFVGMYRLQSDVYIAFYIISRKGVNVNG